MQCNRENWMSLLLSRTYHQAGLSLTEYKTARSVFAWYFYEERADTHLKHNGHAAQHWFALFRSRSRTVFWRGFTVNSQRPLDLGVRSMKPFLNSRRIANSQNAKFKPGQGVNLILAIFMVSISSVHWVHADFWYEDFTDGDLNEGGIDLVFFEDHSISPNGLLLSTPHKFATSAKTASDWFNQREGWSIRTRGRLQQNHGFFGVAAYPLEKNAWAWNAIAAGGAARLGSNYGVGGISDWIPTGLRPFDEDVIVQLDTLDGVMRMWVWPADDSPDEDIAPFIEKSFTLPQLARPLIWARSDDGPSSALFRWMAIRSSPTFVGAVSGLVQLVNLSRARFTGERPASLSEASRQPLQRIPALGA